MMDDPIESSDLDSVSSKKREYAGDASKKLIKEMSRQTKRHYERKDQKLKKDAEIDSATTVSVLSEGLTEQDLVYSAVEERLTPFSSLLCKFIPRDRAEIARIARKLNVSENT